MFDKKQPLWLPKGSVRAVLALGIVGTFVFVAVKNNDIESLKLAVVAVIPAYFIAKVSKTE